MWTAVRALEEGGLLMRRMAAHLRDHAGLRAGDAQRLTEHADHAHQQSEVVRKLVMERQPLAEAKS
jgi:hypothetical protein